MYASVTGLGRRTVRRLDYETLQEPGPTGQAPAGRAELLLARPSGEPSCLHFRLRPTREPRARHEVRAARDGSQTPRPTRRRDPRGTGGARRWSCLSLAPVRVLGRAAEGSIPRGADSSFRAGWSTQPRFGECSASDQAPRRIIHIMSTLRTSVLPAHRLQPRLAEQRHPASRSSPHMRSPAPARPCPPRA